MSQVLSLTCAGLSRLVDKLVATTLTPPAVVTLTSTGPAVPSPPDTGSLASQ